MPLVFLIDYRLAFLALAALIIGSGVSLAFAWARILPEEPPPFDTHAASSEERQSPLGAKPHVKLDPIAIAFLVLVTLAFVSQFPGVPRHAIFVWLAAQFPAISSRWLFLAIQSVLGLVNVAAAIYSLLRANLLRVPLAAASVLVVLLCLLGPYLRAALSAP
jgi:hypothetical protein